MANILYLLVATTIPLFVKHVNAMPCTVGQEPDPATPGKYRWVLPVEDPCRCTELQVGGMITRTPHGPFKVTHYDTFQFSSDPLGNGTCLKCPGEFTCFEEKPLGMENGRISDDSITASSVWENNIRVCGPQKARLNIQGFAASWCKGDKPNPWIQVDFNTIVYIAGLITQGRGDYSQWVEEYLVAYSGQGQCWNNVTDTAGAAITFPGNTDRNTQVTARFPTALYARFIRILPTQWERHCSMRFEVIGCYYPGK